MNIKKRTEGKVKGCLSVRDMYKYYKKNYDEPVDYKLFSQIIKACNKELINKVVKESECVELPYRLGELQIARFERSFKKASNKMAVDWAKTKELGFKVFHDDDNIYKWVWKKHAAIARNKSGYKFTAIRYAKRQVKPAVDNKVQYFKQ
jgi:hypothetical protein